MDNHVQRKRNKSEQRKRANLLLARADDFEKAIITQAALKESLSLSCFMRDAALRRAGDQNTITTSKAEAAFAARTLGGLARISDLLRAAGCGHPADAGIRTELMILREGCIRQLKGTP